MKNVVRILIASSCFVALLGLGTLGGCSAPDEFIQAKCKPDGFDPDPWCLKQVSVNEDAGTDANTDGSNLKDPEYPGLPPSVIFPEDACKGECAPEADGPSADGWPNESFVVWFGSKSEVDKMTCPPETGFQKLKGFDHLVAPPAKCDACTCLANGSCTGLPETIEIRSGKCGIGNVQTTPFNGPGNWDGSCTSANAMPAGKLCNGVPCAQSVSASALPGPTNEACGPIDEKPKATLDKHEWLDGALVCHAKDLVETCATKVEHCVSPPPDGWLRCVMREGKFDECPGNYNDYPPRFVYQDNPIDDRGCSECICGAPKDGICISSLRLYSDGLCSTELNNNLLSSIKPFCVDLTVPGLALGGKTITNLSYVPGTCSVTGGEPSGTVIPNDDGVRTICCRASGLPPLPKPG